MEQIQNLINAGHEYLNIAIDIAPLNDGYIDLEPLITKLNLLLIHIYPQSKNTKVVWIEFEDYIVFDDEFQNNFQAGRIDTKNFGPGVLERCQDFMQELEVELTKFRTILRNFNLAKPCFQEALDIVKNVFYASGDASSLELEPIQEDVEHLEQDLLDLEALISETQQWILELETIRNILPNPVTGISTISTYILGFGGFFVTCLVAILLYFYS